MAIAFHAGLSGRVTPRDQPLNPASRRSRVRPTHSRDVRVTASPDQRTLDDLLQRVREERSQPAFRDLFSYFYPRLVRYFRHGGVDEAKATDLAQEALLAVWNKSSLFDPCRGSCSGWVFTIARNLRFDHARAQARDKLRIGADDLYDDIADPWLGFEEEVLASDVRARVEQLPAEQRDAVQAMYFDGYSHSEYAKQTQLPLGTIKSRLRLAIAQLKKGLGEL